MTRWPRRRTLEAMLLMCVLVLWVGLLVLLRWLRLLKLVGLMVVVLFLFLAWWAPDRKPRCARGCVSGGSWGG